MLTKFSIDGLRCEGQTDPIAIDQPQPGLSWRLVADPHDRGQKQTAYRVLVASNPQLLHEGAADLWDSGRIDDDRCIHVPYGGVPLCSRQQCWWTVRAWDRDGRPTRYAKPARWEMGLLHAEDWTGKWIASSDDQVSAPLLRTTFRLDHAPVRARVHICGLGYHELYLNGIKVGDQVLDPAQTDYPARALYTTHDVTDLLRSGANAMGIWLGKGWFDQDGVWGGMSYGRPCAICQLWLEYPDGSSQLIVTDGSWKWHRSPIVSNNVYAGEHYDARLEVPGWSEPSLDDSAWGAVAVLPAPTARLVSQPQPPIRRMRTLKPVAVKRLRPDLCVFDMGQNFAGWARLRIRAARGTVIRLRFAELAGPLGMIDPGSTGTFATFVEQTDTYVCRGDGEEIWEPRFTYHGFRYVEMSGPVEPAEGMIEGIVVHSAVETTGTFACSDPMLNRIHETAIWTLISNLHGVPTDCPTREKCGWLGDAHVIAEMSCLNFDMSRFWGKYIGDIETSWRHALPGHVAPGKRCNDEQTVDWAVAMVLIPWCVYSRYGDERLLRTHYPSMRRFVRTVQEMFPGGIVEDGLGDWCSPAGVRPVETPVALSSTALYYAAARIAASAAALVGENTQAADFTTLADRVRDAFHARFFDVEKGGYGSQTADSLALCLDLVPSAHRQSVADDLRWQVRERHDGHLATGIFGSKYLHGALADFGEDVELALAVLRTQTHPGFGHLFSLGATTFWECWPRADLDRHHSIRYSCNHPMQGALDAWFFEGLAGIRVSSQAPGYKHVVLQPQVAQSLSFVRATHDSPYGRILSHWQWEGELLKWLIELPPNTTATAYLPTRNMDGLLESSRPWQQAAGLSLLQAADARAAINLQSGRYAFTLPVVVQSA